MLKQAVILVEQWFRSLHLWQFCTFALLIKVFPWNGSSCKAAFLKQLMHAKVPLSVESDYDCVPSKVSNSTQVTIRI